MYPREKSILSLIKTGLFTARGGGASSKSAQSINGFPATLTLTIAQTPYALPATTTAGLTPTYTVASGPATVSGTTLTLTGTGTVVVNATQAGNSNYLSYSGSESITVTKVSQTLNTGFPPTLSLTMGQTPYTLPATTDQGLTLTYVITSGPATVSGNTLTLTGAGTVVVGASQAGNTTYAAFSGSESISVTALAQTVTGFPATLSLTMLQTPHTLTANTDQGLAITYVVASGPATVSGNTLTLTGAGTVVVNGSQAGNATYTAWSGSESITVTQVAQTLASGFPPTLSLSTTASPYSLPATTDQGLTITYVVASGPATVSGHTLTLTGAGTVVVNGSQAGNATYTSWSGSETITVTAPAFLPTSLSGLSIWLDGQDSSTLTTSSNLVSQWNDKSTNGYNVTGTSGSEPTLTASGINGFQAINFFGGQALANASGAGINLGIATDLTAIMVVAMGSGSFAQHALTWAPTSGGSTSMSILNDDSGNLPSILYYSSTGALGPETATPIGTGVVATSVVASGNVSQYTNGTQQGSAQAVGLSINTGYLYVGTKFNYTYAWNGFIGEIIIYDRALNSTELSQITSYLRTKWGI